MLFICDEHGTSSLAVEAHFSNSLISVNTFIPWTYSYFSSRVPYYDIKRCYTMIVKQTPILQPLLSNGSANESVSVWSVNNNITATVTNPYHRILGFLYRKKKTNSMAPVRKRTIPTERPPLVSEVSASFLWIEGATWSAWLIPTAVFSAF
jgi:hypothetical protein